MKSLLTPEKLKTIIEYASKAPLKGIFAECGVYKGGSIRFLAEHFPKRTILGFDTFNGLPIEHWTQSEHHAPQEFGDTSLEEVTNFIKPYNNIKLIKGLFPSTAKIFEKEKFAFVHIDFDFYEGTKLCLDWFWPRLMVGGIMLFDDYEWKNCPGVKKALDEFRYSKAFPITEYQAILIKKIKLL